MEGVLGTVADGLTGQQRQDYNPLEAYQSLMERTLSRRRFT